MKLTEDGHFVSPHDIVWEILFERLNGETSVAYPARVNAYDTTKRIWMHRFPCSMECLKINKANQYVSLDEQPVTVKMIAK